MDHQERRTVRTVFTVASLIAVVAVLAFGLLKAERRIRRLLYLLESRLNPKSTAFKVEL